MKQSRITNMDTERLELYYAERIAILQSVNMAAMLKSSFLPDLIWEGKAALIVRRLLESYLLFLQPWWHEYVRSSEFAEFSTAVSVNQLPSRADYEMEFAKAENRITLDFVSMYCTRSGQIDWKLLIQNLEGAS